MQMVLFIWYPTILTKIVKEDLREVGSASSGKFLLSISQDDILNTIIMSTYIVLHIGENAKIKARILF